LRIEAFPSFTLLQFVHFILNPEFQIDNTDNPDTGSFDAALLEDGYAFGETENQQAQRLALLIRNHGKRGGLPYNSCPSLVPDVKIHAAGIPIHWDTNKNRPGDCSPDRL